MIGRRHEPLVGAVLVDRVHLAVHHEQDAGRGGPADAKARFEHAIREAVHGEPESRVAEGREAGPQLAAHAPGRHIVHRDDGAVAGRGRDADDEVRPEGLVQRIVETGRDGCAAGPPGPPPRPGRGTAGRRGRGGARGANRVTAGQGDRLEAVAVVDIARDKGANRVERRLRNRQHHHPRPHAGAVHDADADAAIDRGGVLGG